MSRWALVGVMLLLAGCSAAVSGTAAPATTQVRPSVAPTLGGAPSDLPTVGGTTNTAGGPPSWVTAGTRISYYEAAASVAQSRFEWVQDPSGTWVDPKTGTHYRRTDESGEGVATAGGDGISAYDVLAAGGAGVVVANSLYGIDHTNNIFDVAGVTGGVVSGPVLNGVWISPDTLRSLQTSLTGTLQVLTGPYPLGGKTYQAISFASTDPNAYQSYTYDSATGLLLVATTSTAGATSPVAAPGESAPKGNTQLTSTILAGVRQRSVPGLGGSDPSWVGRRLDYTGTYQWTNPVDPSSGSLSYPVQIGVAFTAATSPWFTYTATSLIQMPGASQQTVSGVSGPSGLYWIDPAALSSLDAGQSLDSDPLTREALTVADRDDQSVTLSDVLPGVSTTAVYSATSGALTSLTQHLAGTGATITVRLQSAP